MAQFDGEFGRDACVLNSQKPRRAIRIDTAGKRDLSRHALIGFEPEPPIGDPVGLAEPMIEGSLIELYPKDRMGSCVDRRAKGTPLAG